MAVLEPNVYSKHLKTLTLNQSLIFFSINASIWLLLSAAINTFLLKKFHLFFAVLSETLILVIVIFLFSMFYTVILHLLAKVFGSRTKIKNNLKAVLFSTILLPFFAVPIFKVLAVIISMYILIFDFKAINRFDKLKASIAVIIPTGMIIFGLYEMGIVNINLIAR